MSYTEALIRRLCEALWTSVTRNAAQDYRFAQWLQMPLPRNDYWDLVRPKESTNDAKRQRTKEPGSPALLQSPLDRLRASSGGGGLRMAAIVTDGRAAMASVDATLGDERALALRVMEDAARKHFDFSQPGVVPKITQLLLVLALEPCQLSLEFVLRKRFDDDFVVRNFLATAAEPVPPADAVAWHRDVKRMTFNLFERFPELALNCDVGSDLTQLRAVQHLWCLADCLFGKCATTLHSESAHQFAYNGILCELARNRAPLLEAVARANVYAAGTDPGRFALRRDLFAEAFVCAQLHILQLHTHAPPNSDIATRLQHTLDCLKQARAAVALFEAP